MDLSKNRILIVDDEIDTARQWEHALKKVGFNTSIATSGAECIATTIKLQPHIILLDLSMPDMDGIETCEELRKNKLTQNSLIAFFTTHSEDYSQIAAFDAGADDYIVKPINIKVLTSRINALLRRSTQIEMLVEKPQAIPDHGVYIDKEQYVVYANGIKLYLPRKEFELLALLYSKPQKVFTRDEIYQTIWGDDIIVGDRTIDVHIRKLREKIGESHIHTVKGVGYRFTS